MNAKEKLERKGWRYRCTSSEGLEIFRKGSQEISYNPLKKEPVWFRDLHYRKGKNLLYLDDEIFEFLIN